MLVKQIRSETYKWNRTEGYHYYEGRVYKSKEASFFPSSVRKTYVFLTQSYGRKLYWESLIQFFVKWRKKIKNQGLD